MDSKKKGIIKKSTKKQFKRCTVLDGIAITEMTREQLESHINRLQQEVEKEKEERNYYQVERDRIQLFWEVSKQQLKEKNALLQLKDHELDEIALTHLAEIKLYKQKMKHIMLESQQCINDNLKENISFKLAAEADHEKQLNLLETEIQKLKNEAYELKTQHNEAIAEVNLKHGEQLCCIQTEYSNELDELKSKEVLEIEEIRKLLDSQCKETVKRIEEERNSHIERLITTHEQLLIKMKNYYNDIIQNNICLLHSEKEKLNQYQKEKRKVEKQLEIILDEKTNLQTELLNNEETILQLKKKVEKLEHPNDIVLNLKLKFMSQEMKKVKWDNDELVEKIQQIEKEKKDLHKKLKMAVQHVVLRSELKSIIQERKLSLSDDKML